MKKIKKSIDSTIVRFVTVEKQEDGSPKMTEHEPMKLEGKLNERKARNKVYDVLQKDFTVLETSHVSDVYEMDVAEFMELASIVAE